MPGINMAVAGQLMQAGSRGLAHAVEDEHKAARAQKMLPVSQYIVGTLGPLKKAGRIDVDQFVSRAVNRGLKEGLTVDESLRLIAGNVQAWKLTKQKVGVDPFEMMSKQLDVMRKGQILEEGAERLREKRQGPLAKAAFKGAPDLLASTSALQYGIRKYSNLPERKRLEKITDWFADQYEGTELEDELEGWFGKNKPQSLDQLAIITAEFLKANDPNYTPYTSAALAQGLLRLFNGADPESVVKTFGVPTGRNPQGGEDYAALAMAQTAQRLGK